MNDFQQTPQDPAEPPVRQAGEHDAELAAGCLRSGDSVGMDRATAEERRRQVERAGKLSALALTILVHGLAMLILALIVLPGMQVDVPQIRAKALPPTESAAVPVVATATVQSRPSAPSAAARLITSHAAVPTVFAPDQIVEMAVADPGAGALGMGFGGLGLGDGQGGLGGLPGVMRGRCTHQERMRRLRERGGTEACELAVVKALRWLKERQNADGSWGRNFKVSMTGLALLAYLGHCETPKSGEFGRTVTRAMEYLINVGLKGRGRLAGVGGHAWVYEQAIATYALCEALTFVKELKIEFPGLQDVCRQAVSRILSGQHPSGFWDYSYNRGGGRRGDLSIAGWHLQALKAAQHAGFDSAELRKVANQAMKMVEAVQGRDGTFGYTKREELGQRLTGVGVLSLQLWGRGGGNHARRGIAWMGASMEPVYTASNCNLYAWYYTTLAMFQHGSTDWTRWNRKWLPQLLESQNDDGSWRREGGFDSNPGHLTTKAAGGDADIYRTCLNVLSLEVYYRFLPGTG
jgi:hypothetical protein